VASTLGAIDWKWGILRGGTPAVLDGDHYLAIFHSYRKMTTVQSNGRFMRNYFMGAYTFSSEPPFEIRSISPEPIISKNLYSGTSIIFPSGLLVNEDFVWVIYGKRDKEAWVAKIDKKKLLNSLIPVLPYVEPVLPNVEDDVILNVDEENTSSDVILNVDGEHTPNDVILNIDEEHTL
jgi:hypothetical protein